MLRAQGRLIIRLMGFGQSSHVLTITCQGARLQSDEGGFMIYVDDWDNDGQTRAKIMALNRAVNEFYANENVGGIFRYWRCIQY